MNELTQENIEYSLKVLHEQRILQTQWLKELDQRITKLCSYIEKLEKKIKKGENHD